MSRKVLYLTVADYPFGYGEPFLEDELQIVSKYFDEIHLIVTNHDNFPPENTENKFIFSLPSNTYVHLIKTELGIYEKYFKPEIFDIGLYWEALYLLRNTYEQRITFYKLKLISSYIKKAKKFFNQAENVVKKTSREGDIRLFYTYWLNEFTLGNIFLRKKFPGSHVVSRAHGWDVYFERNKENYLPFRKYLIENLDALFLISDHGRKYLTDKFRFSDPINLYTARLGSKRIRPGSITVPENKSNLSLLTLAFLVPVKRMDLAIAAIEKVLETGCGIEWTHIGNGSGQIQEQFLNAVNKLSKKYPKFNFDFKGRKSKNEIIDILESNYFDILLNTSDYEGLPVSMMEAMSAGIPCIGRNVGGVSEIISHQYNGFLCPAKSTDEELAKAIIQYIDLPLQKKQSFHHNAYKFWEDNFDSENNFKRFAENLIYILNQENQNNECKICLYNKTNCSEVKIDFDGTCNFCKTYTLRKERIDVTRNSPELEEIIRKIKRHRGKYNCIVGVSGGVDSTYTAYLVKKVFGLNPLAVHLDNGWNSEIAVQNIQRCLQKLEIDLYTHVINWEEFKDLQLSYLKASVIDIEVLTDHAILATLYKAAIKYKIPYIISGENFTTEGLLPKNWVYAKNDLLNIRAIHRRYGKMKIKTFPMLGYVRKYIFDKLYSITYIPILDYYPYDRNAAKRTLENELGWIDYGGKHFESTFTKIYQAIILPEKFKVDKRVSHLSTLICAGQMTRQEAASVLNTPTLSPEERRNLIRFACDKFHLTEDIWNEIINSPPVPHDNYPSVRNRKNRLKNLLFNS